MSETGSMRGAEYAERPRVPKGGECSGHGSYGIGPDCPKCVREVLEWMA